MIGGVMRNTCRLLVLVMGAWGLSSCGGGKAPAPGPVLPVQSPPDNLDPGKGGTPTDIEAARKKAAEEAMARSVAKEEFQLTLVADDPAVKQIDSIHIDVISADAREAARLLSEGPVKYRNSRKTGDDTRSHTFKNGGRFEVKVPTIVPTDTIVLWAELAAPAEGVSDTRMLVIPLALDKSDPSKGPQANPIMVKLTANGWMRQN